MAEPTRARVARLAALREELAFQREQLSMFREMGVTSVSLSDQGQITEVTLGPPPSHEKQNDGPGKPAKAEQERLAREPALMSSSRLVGVPRASF